MPSTRPTRSFASRTTFAAIGALALAFATASRAPAQDIPPRLADSTFWRMVSTYSEPSGYFRSDNFVSNENSYQYVIPELVRLIKPGSAYLGVAPDQNFAYMIALKPKIAFIVDIRHQNAMQHLMYKALFELSADRADFVSRLFARPRPAGLDSMSRAEAIFQAFDAVRPDSALWTRNFAAIRDLLVKRHGFALDTAELGSLEYIYDAFYSAGPNLTYNFGQGGRGNYGGGFSRGMPSYQSLMVESDGSGQNRAYLGTEANYRVMKDLETRNLIVPLTGNFAGPRALRTVGEYLKAHGMTVGAFYTSNVEQYLFQQGDEWKKWHENVAALPLDSASTFIRSYSAGGGGYGFRMQSPNGRSAQLISSMLEQVKAFREGKITGYLDVILMSRQ